MLSMARALSRLSLGVAALSLVACGGEDKGRPSGERVVAPEVDQCARADGYETRSIVAFENIDRTPTCDINACQFYVNHDKLTVLPNPANEGPPIVPESEHCVSLEPAQLDPEPPDTAPRSKPSPGGARCGTSKGVIRFKAINVGQCYGPDGRLGWGANLEVKFVSAPGSAVPAPLDASGADGTGPWDGIGFWAMRASQTSDASAILSINDVASDGFNDEAHPVDHCGCVPNGDGTFHCYSDPPASVPDSAKCDPFGVAFTVTDQWNFVRVRFADLTQKGFGFPLASLDISAITRLQFLVSHGSNDFYIDDISLFREK